MADPVCQQMSLSPTSHRHLIPDCRLASIATGTETSSSVTSVSLNAADVSSRALDVRVNSVSHAYFNVRDVVVALADAPIGALHGRRRGRHGLGLDWVHRVRLVLIFAKCAHGCDGLWDLTERVRARKSLQTA